jgi:hypothetical protein
VQEVSVADHRRHLDLSSAALQDIISCGAAYNAAAIRDDREAMEAIRVRARDHVDAYLDHYGEAAVAMRMKLPT